MRRRRAIGLDLGGTYLKGGVVDADGVVHFSGEWLARVTESAEAPLETVAHAVEALDQLAEGATVGVGLGVPGAVHPDTGSLVGRTAHLPHWDSFPLRRRVASRLGLPVVVDNDANLAALAEHRLGAARGARVSITVMIGTGVGCGIVIGDRLLRGAWGGAGEIGHLPLGGEVGCRCGVQGCVEPEMSGSGLARAAREAGLLVEDAGAVFAAAADGDARARRLVARAADRLGASIAVAVNLLNPEVVVVGGGVARAGEALLEPLRAALDRYALASHRGGLRVVAARFGPRAGVVGAGLLALDAAARR
jgi:glucokinase